jgi:hypothetical protein
MDQIYLQSMDDVLSIRPFAPDDADLQRFDVLTQGITERHLLRFQYKKPGERSSRPRRVHPYHMLEFGSRWYLIAYDLDEKVVRKYVLGRMQDLELTNERFTDRKDFDPKTYFKGSVGVVTGEGDYDGVVGWRLVFKPAAELGLRQTTIKGDLDIGRLRFSVHAVFALTKISALSSGLITRHCRF